jgi:hypothetical protein
METSDVVLVTGATGGVGRRVVDILRKKGVPIRVLVFYCQPYSFWPLTFSIFCMNSRYSPYDICSIF